MGLLRIWPIARIQVCRRFSTDPEWPSNRVRRTFIDYFSSLGYIYVQSSSIMPYDDHSLLYVNAGMNQFKPIFLGTLNPGAKRAQLRLAVNSQKCVRVGGRDKDLRQVGRDGYHHTFFEMLGSWSFNGHLPKKEVCQQTLRLLTDVYRLPKERLFVTYFEGYEPFGLLPDTECKELWRELGVDDSQILGRGVEDNFWEMSPSGGPCGPCTEILYSATNPPRADDNVELWNIVFMQYNKLSDGKLTPLPAMHIDTGMGLERLCCVLQNVASTYDTDLFRPLLREIETQSGGPSYLGRFGEADKSGIDTAYRIIADHARMFTVSIADGLSPADTDKAGTILRRVIRSAAYQSSVLASHLPESSDPTGRLPRLHLSNLCDTVASILGQAYPELYDHAKYVRDVVAQEEAKFYAAMTKAKVRLALLVKDSGGNLSTADLASFYLSYHLPYAAFLSLAQKRGLKMNAKELENEVEKQLSKPTGVTSTATAPRAGPEQEAAKVVSNLQANRIAMTDDSFKYQVKRDSSGHYTIPTCESKVVAIVHNNHLTATAPPNEECDVVLDRTPFYAQADRQVGDRGTLRWGSAIFNVTDTFTRGGYVFHRGQLTMGGLARSDTIQAFVDTKWRIGCTQHHTGTHLLMAILERVLGPVRQRTCTLDAESSRLGFWCASVVTPELMLRVEREANDAIRRNPPVYIEEMPLEKTKQCPDIRWLIGVYYPDSVRVVSIGVPPRRLLDQRQRTGPVSMSAASGSSLLSKKVIRENDTLVDEPLPTSFISAELCGGTHVAWLGDIQRLRIIALEGSGSSVKTVTFTVGASAVAAEERGKTLKEEINAAWENVQKGSASADKLLALRAKVVDAVIPLEIRTHLLHDILDLRKTQLKGQAETDSPPSS